MPVFRWRPSWDPFRDLEREMDRLLSSVSLSFQGMRLGRQYPAMNVYELDSEYLLTAELPGLRPDEIELTVANGVLTLRGRRSGIDGVPDDRYRRQERPRGVWQRSLALPERVSDDQMSAEFSHGVLKIHLPRSGVTRSRQIPVAEAEGTAPLPETVVIPQSTANPTATANPPATEAP